MVPRSAFSPQPVRTSGSHPVRSGVQLVAEQVAVPVQRHGGRGLPEVLQRLYQERNEKLGQVAERIAESGEQPHPRPGSGGPRGSPGLSGLAYP